jgi:hypothetical protein
MLVLEPSSDEPLIGPEAPAMAGSAPGPLRVFRVVLVEAGCYVTAGARI